MKKSRIAVVLMVLLVSFAIGASMASAARPPQPIELESCDYIVPIDEHLCYCCNVRGDNEICKIYLCW